MSDRAAFFSYSHEGDLGFARALQAGVERFGRSWRQVRVRTVFFDTTSLSAGGGLWSSIERELERARWLVLIASPQAARSPWVERELAWWLEHRGRERIALVVADGTLEWDPAARDFAPERSSALPRVLHGRLSEEPAWIDATWSRRSQQLDGASPAFQDVVATLVATIEERPKEELVAEAVREQRRTRRLIVAAVATLALLLVLAIAAAVLAVHQRQTAQRQSRLATARQLAATSSSLLDTNLPVALLLAVRGLRTADVPQTRAALASAALAAPQLQRYLWAQASVTQVAGSADGSTIVAGLGNGRVEAWHDDARRPAVLFALHRAVTQVSVSADGATVAATDGSRAEVWQRGHAARPIVPPAGEEPDAVGLSPSGRLLVDHGAAPVFGGRESYELTSTADGRAEGSHVTHRQDLAGTPTIVVSDEDHVLLFDPGYGGWERRVLSTWALLDRSSVLFGAHQAAGDPSSDGRYVTATNGATAVPLWRTAGPSENDRPDLTAEAPIAHPTALALSPDGSRLAVGDSGAIYVAGTAPPAAAHPQATRLGGNGSVDELRFFRDSDHLLSTSGRAIAVWSLTQPDRLAESFAVPVGASCNACAAAHLAISPDGTRVAAGDGDGAAVAVQEMRPGARAQKLGTDVNLDFAVGPPVWEPDSRHVDIPLSSGVGATALPAPEVLPTAMRAWPADDGTQPAVASADADDGSDVIVVDATGRVFLQNRYAGAVERQWGRLRELAFSNSTLSSAAIHVRPDLVATAVDEQARVRALPSGRSVGRIPGADVTAVAYAGPWLLVQRRSGQLEVWDATGTTRRRTLPGDTSFSWPPVGNAQGTLVARRRSDGSVVVVDLASATTLAVLPPPAELGLRKLGVAFGPDGTDVATIAEPVRYGRPSTVVRRDLAPRRLVRSACDAAGRDLSPAEWRTYVGTAPPADLACR